MQKAAVALGVFLIAGLWACGYTAQGAPAATQNALIIGPAPDEGTIKLHLFMGEGGGEALLMVHAKDAAKLAESLREDVRKAADRKHGDVRCDIQISSNVPYRYLATVLIAAAQANVKRFRLSTDGKDFIDETMPAIDRQGVAMRRVSIKLSRKDGEIWISGLASAPNKLGDGAQRAAVADQISVIGKHFFDGPMMVIIEPGADVPCGDVLVICKDCAQEGMQQVGFAPAGEAATQPRENASAPPTVAATSPFKRPPSHIVYIVDASASVADSFPALQKETIHAINNMIPVQRFDVVLLTDKPAAIFTKLERATADSKKDAAKQLTAFKAGGKIDGQLAPFQDAFEKAFALKPDLIYFISGSTFDPQLLKIVAQLNKDQNAAVNAIVFERKDKKLEDLMTELAQANRGLYKFVSQADAQREMPHAKQSHSLLER